MIISQTAGYALRAMVHLADLGNGKPTRVDDIASALSVPRNYLSKILHTLTQAGLLSSMRGPGGGFTLASQPSNVRLVEVIRLFDARDGDHTCLMGQDQCRAEGPCPAHSRWAVVKEQVTSFLSDTTISDLMASQHHVPPSPSPG